MKNKSKQGGKHQEKDEKDESVQNKVDEAESNVEEDADSRCGWILISILTLLLIVSVIYALFCPIGLSAVSGEVKVSDIFIQKFADLKEKLMNVTNYSSKKIEMNITEKEEDLLLTVNEAIPVKEIEKEEEENDDDDLYPFKSKTAVIKPENILNDKYNVKGEDKEKVNEEKEKVKEKEVEEVKEKEEKSLKVRDEKEIIMYDDDTIEEEVEKSNYIFVDNNKYRNTIYNLTVHLSTDKQYYQPGENIFIRGIFNNDFNNSISKYYYDDYLCLTMESYSNNKEIFKICPRINTYVLHYIYHIPRNITCGEFVIKVLNIPNVNRTIHIQEYNIPHFISEIKFDKEGYGENDMVSGILKVNESGNNEKIKLNDVEISTIIDEKEIRGNGTISEGEVKFNLQLPNHIKDNNAVINILMYYNHYKESIIKTIPILSYELDIRVYTESGSNLINNVKNRIYFECYEKNGNPCDFEGIIVEVKDKEVKEIMKIKTIHEGRGKSDYFIAEIDKDYEIRVTNPSSVRTMIKLPIVVNGITLSSIQPCYDNKGDVKMLIEGSEKKGNYLIGLYKKRVLIDIIKVNLEENKSVTIKFNESRIDSLVGIFRVTLFDEEYNPLNERLIFIKPSHKIEVLIESSKKEYSPNEEVELKIKTIDSITHKPIRSEISVTVTDESVLNINEKRLHEPSLPSTIYLENEVKHLEDSEVYLKENKESGEYIDLLLGSQGWRRFLFNCSRCNKNEYNNKLVLNQYQTYHYWNDFSINDLFSVSSGSVDIRSGNGVTMGGNIDIEIRASSSSFDGFSGSNSDSNEISDNNIRNDDILLKRIEKILEIKLDSSIRVYAKAPPSLSSTSSSLDNIRKDFSNTVYWSSSESCSKEGKNIKFHSSDSLTTYRVKVDSFQLNNNIFGHSEMIFTVNKQLKINYNIPKEINDNDVIGISVIIENKKINEEMIMEVKVFGGIIIEKNNFQWIQNEESHKEVILVKGVYNKELNIAGDDDKKEKEGMLNTINGGILIKVSNGKENDSMYKSIRIREKGYPHSLSISTRYSGNDIPISFSLGKGSYLDTFKMKISIYSTSFTNNLDSIKSLIREPYGCFEQTSSVVYPMIMAMKYMKIHQIYNKELHEEGMKYLKNGYKRLINYQTKEGGFEWFGHSPASTTLTAYGLMEFEELKEFINVNKEMLNRAYDWLKSGINKENGYFQTQKKHQISVKGKEDSSAYIYWCLSENKEMSDNVKSGYLKFSENVVITKSNSYIMGLIGLTYYNLGLIEKSKEMSMKLRSMFKEGHIIDENEIETITWSYGKNKIIESSCLGLLLFLRLNENIDILNEGIEWLNKQNVNGLYGSTQSTILSLKVLNEYEERRLLLKNVISDELEIECYLNEEKICSESLMNLSDHSSLNLNDYSTIIKHDKNSLIIKGNTVFNTSFPISIFLKFNTDNPSNSENNRVMMEYNLNKNEVQQGEEVDIRIRIKNKVEEGIGMVVSVIGIPGGLKIRFKELDEMINREVISSYEMRGSELLLYWRNLSPNEEKEFVIHSVGEIAGNYHGSVSYVYEYYNNEVKSWLTPLHILIMP